MAQALYHAQIGNFHFGLHENENKDKSALDHVIDYADSSSGVFRIVQTLEKVIRLAGMALKEVGSVFASSFEYISGKLTKAWSALIIPRLPGVTKDAYKAVQNWTKGVSCPGPEGHDQRMNLKGIHDVAECAASYGYAATFFVDHSGIKNAADTADLVSKATELSMAAEDYGLAKKYLEQIDTNTIDARLKTRFEDTKTEAFLRIVKSVASVVTGALGLAVLALGGPVLPAVILLGISLVGSIAAIAAHFFKETREYEIVSFFKNKFPNTAPDGSLIY